MVILLRRILRVEEKGRYFKEKEAEKEKQRKRQRETEKEAERSRGEAEREMPESGRRGEGKGDTRGI